MTITGKKPPLINLKPISPRTWLQPFSRASSPGYWHCQHCSLHPAADQGLHACHHAPFKVLAPRVPPVQEKPVFPLEALQVWRDHSSTPPLYLSLLWSSGLPRYPCCLSWGQKGSMPSVGVNPKTASGSCFCAMFPSQAGRVGVVVIFLWLTLIISSQDGKNMIFYSGLFNWVVIEVNDLTFKLFTIITGVKSRGAGRKQS